MARDLAGLIELLRRGPVPAARVAAGLGVSRATLSRLVRAASGVVRIGQARATSYALEREIRTFGTRWPIYRVGADGRAWHAANLHALEPRAWWYEPIGQRPAWLVGEHANGLFPDLPWFLDDLRPQGFMGRAFARRHAEGLGLSPDPRLWDASGVLVALLLFGDDLPGDFVVGDAALGRVQRASLSPPAAIALADRAAHYSQLALAALHGEVPGSSAAGEQPKFTACVLEASGNLRHVLVKFSPVCDSPSGQRWADLLVCEHLAAEVLREHQVAACSTEVLEGGGRRFLEVTRFDRVGAFGRVGFVTLLPLDATYYGKLDSWAAAADRLERDGWLDSEEATRMRLLWWFGGLIGNSDMHFGNLSLTLDSRPFRLAPAYDMLPMIYRPEAGGEVVTRQPFAPPLPTPPQLPVWRRAASLAALFWQRVADDTRVSTGMRAEAVRVLESTRMLRDRFG
ncbi:MAG: type II toxin-antitoxin system HipA family toxin YjjJ [Deltaproteobacteria bacterium]|nr:type II toxin-antitoxin system HipA family toxin YjjJ [Deltaproteobacteria bacterium]